MGVIIVAGAGALRRGRAGALALGKAKVERAIVDRAKVVLRGDVGSDADVRTRAVRNDRAARRRRRPGVPVVEGGGVEVEEQARSRSEAEGAEIGGVERGREVAERDVAVVVVRRHEQAKVTGGAWARAVPEVEARVEARLVGGEGG